MGKIEELDVITITKSFGKIRKGSYGTVVHIYADGKAFEVEFVTKTGKTTGMLTIDKKWCLPYWSVKTGKYIR